MPDSRMPIPPHVTGRAPSRLVWIVVLLVSLAAVAVGMRSLSPVVSGSPQHAAVPPAVTMGVGPVWGEGQAPATGAYAMSPVDLEPSTLLLGRLGVAAPVGTSTTPGGILTPPEDVSTVGLWLGGPGLAAEEGTTVLAGHVNAADQGRGALFELALVQPGDIIHTADEHGDVAAWRVTSLQQRPKAQGVDERVFTGAQGPRRLAVITCGGELDYVDGVGDYTDNIYLYAVPAD